jgi:hypothetical protein
MGIENLFSYNALLELQDKTLEIYPQPCTIFIPDNFKTLGYEDSSIDKSDSTGVNWLGCHWQKLRTSCWIEFAIKKQVFYHFNWFPNASDELVMALFKIDSRIRDDCFVRTKIPGQVSVWGDQLFKCVKIMDDGKFQTLKRTHFLRSYVSNELTQLFDNLMKNEEDWLDG